MIRGFIIILLIITILEFLIKGYKNITPNSFISNTKQISEKSNYWLKAPKWKYYILYTIAQIFNLGIIGCIIYTLTQL